MYGKRNKGNPHHVDQTLTFVRTNRAAPELVIGKCILRRDAINKTKNPPSVASLQPLFMSLVGTKHEPIEMSRGWQCLTKSIVPSCHFYFRCIFPLRFSRWMLFRNNYGRDLGISVVPFLLSETYNLTSKKRFQTLCSNFGLRFQHLLHRLLFLR